MKKRMIEKIELQFEQEIGLARANGYEGVIVPIDENYNLEYLDNISDSDAIIEMALEFGWDRFIIIHFQAHGNKSRLYNMKIKHAA